MSPLESNLNKPSDTKAHLVFINSISDAGHIVGLMDFSEPLSEQHGFMLISIGR